MMSQILVIEGFILQFCTKISKKEFGLMTLLKEAEN